MKCVAVQGNLDWVEKELRERGYHVVSLEHPGVVDAIVYENSFQSFENINGMGELNGIGAIIVNAHNKAIEEIIYAIENRKYGNLIY